MLNGKYIKTQNHKVTFKDKIQQNLMNKIKFFANHKDLETTKYRTNFKNCAHCKIIQK